MGVTMSSAEADVRHVRLARNQILFREVNERFEKMTEHFVADGPLSFVCECSDVECASQVSLTRDQYEHVRSMPTWFAVRPGHEIPEIEDVVAANGAFAIVAKREAAGEVAAAADPRRAR
jgi:hypothetical protein